ncbi:unannotated protein [freshwater metagenome]|uniref:Unannotated protein n=1 Tax=freshwater metagenome TaxID=449393 RepID=A0A6J6E9R5_9ZZZZ|nr:hypothetical protein [Actinomycetota bacterium]
MSDENNRELEPRFYRAVGATGPQSEKAFPALARRREKNTEDKFADSQEIAKKVENFYKGTSPNQVITEQLTQNKERVSFSERVSWLQPPLPAKTAALLILVVPLIIGLIDVLLTGRIGIITSFAYSITLLYLAATINMRNAWDPVIAGPVAYLIVALILGQLTLSPTGSFMLKQTAMILTTLAFNAPWMVGSTAIAFAIVFLRIRRSV